MATLYFITLLFLSFLLATVTYAAISFAPWVPVWKKDLPRIFGLANLQKGETFYDLGCGDGKTVVYAAREHGAQAIGVELAFPLYFVCMIRKWLNRQYDINFRFGNLFNQNLSDADVIYVFGMPKTLQQKLCAKIKKEVKSGTRIVSYIFPIEGLTPTKMDKPSQEEHKVYLYVM